MHVEGGVRKVVGPRKPERVSPFKKAKIAMEQRAEIAKRKKRDKDSLGETWRALLQNSIPDVARYQNPLKPKPTAFRR